MIPGLVQQLNNGVEDSISFYLSVLSFVAFLFVCLLTSHGHKMAVIAPSFAADRKKETWTIHVYRSETSQQVWGRD